MTIEDPDVLLRRLRLGREEYCQRLLTMLIIGDAYPRWNSVNHPVYQRPRVPLSAVSAVLRPSAL